MLIVAENGCKNTKKVHCPICGGRLCDVSCSENVVISKNYINGIILKCYKCKNHFSISIN